MKFDARDGRRAWSIERHEDFRSDRALADFDAAVRLFAGFGACTIKRQGVVGQALGGRPQNASAILSFHWRWPLALAIGAGHWRWPLALAIGAGHWRWQLARIVLDRRQIMAAPIAVVAADFFLREEDVTGNDRTVKRQFLEQRQGRAHLFLVRRDNQIADHNTQIAGKRRQ
jgi:hypothetical protein